MRSLICAAAMLLVVAEAADPVIGTWVLSRDKSSFSSGKPVREQTRVYEQTPNGIAFTLTGSAPMENRCASSALRRMTGRITR